MKINIYFWLTLCVIFINFNQLSAQQTTPNTNSPYRVSQPTSVNQVPSIASRINDLTPANLIGNNEMLDARYSVRDRKIKVIPGKGSTGDDTLATLQINANKSSGRTPELVFETAVSNSQPTDPAGAVGPNHYIAVTNTAFRIFDKSGNPLTALLPPNPSIFPSSGCCDLTASYDNIADRWVLSFLGSGAQIAVSNGPDPLNDTWTVYNYAQVVDYQKLSVWHDGYYMTDNTSGTFHVFERNEMLAGNTGAQLVSFTVPGWQDPGGFDSPQFLNLSHNAPVTGPATMVYIADDSWGSVTQDDHIKLWSVSVDWANTTSSTVTGPTRLGVDAFGVADGTVTPFNSTFDGGAFSNLTQPNGGIDIDALQWTIMNQAQFRKFTTHNSALFNFVVDTDGSPGELAGVRWYELRQNGDGQPWTIYQEGTYVAPEGKHAWNASMMMDVQGNIGMGYTSMSGPTTPSTIRVGSYYTGQLAASSGSGVMDVAEEVIIAGDANIPGVRYGDYSKIDIDPANDKKFWFVNELMQNGRKNYCGVFQIAPNTNNDVGVTSVDSPTDGDLSTNETVIVTIFNYGQNPASGFNVTYQIDGGSTISEPFTSTLASGASTQFTFSTQADFSVEGQSYEVIACTDLTNDEDNSNDCNTSNITHILSNDLGVTAITAPTNGGLGTTEQISVTIENFGTTTQSGCGISYQIDGGATVTETVSSSIPAGGSVSYTFTQTADLSIAGQSYQIQACTVLTGDQDPSNDCKTSNVLNQVIVCQPLGDCSFGDGITQFQLGNINENNIPCSTGYEDLTSITTDLDRSSGNNLYSGTLQTGWAEEHFSIWIDLNNNGDFTDSGELVLDTFIVPNGGNNTDQPFSITVPTNANLGSHILRVRGYDPDYGGVLNNPCDDLQYGNTVDFSVNIVDSTLSNGDLDISNNSLVVITKPNKQFEISLESDYTKKLTFNLYNTMGQQIVYGTMDRNTSGNHTYNLDMSYASSGIYIVKVGAGDRFSTAKIIVK